MTHAAGHEHPSQFAMKDIQVNVDDDYLSSDLRTVYGYEKTAVPFKSMKTLKECPHLGGKKEAYA